MGIYSDFASKYFELGYQVIPVLGKIPQVPKYENYSFEPMSAEDLERYSSEHGGCGVGLVLGPQSGVIGFDMDTYNPKIIEEIEKIIPPSPIRKKGEKGYTGFYKYTDKMRTQKLKTSAPQKSDRRDGCDFLISRCQTVLPPSPHKTQGIKYEWVTHQTLLDVEPADLPEFPAHLIPQIKWILDNYALPDPEIVELLKSGKIKPQKGAAGRNDYLKAVIAREISFGKKKTEIIDFIEEEDRNCHTPPLFSDSSHYPGSYRDSWKTASIFFHNIATSISEDRKRRGLNPLNLSDEDEKVGKPIEEYQCETYANGFYWLIPGTKEVGRGDNKKTIEIIQEIPDYKGCADYIKNKYKLKSSKKFLCIYTGKHYEFIDDLDLTKAIEIESKGRIKPPHRDTFTRETIVKAPNPEFPWNYPAGFLNCSNGVIHLKTKELKPHSHAYGFKYVLDYNYNPLAYCPRFEEFLLTVLDSDLQRIHIIQEYMGYVLAGGHPWMHKALCLIGEGNNGKSTLIDIIRMIIGNANTSNVSMRDLERPFSVVDFDGKLVNMVDETPTSCINSEMFKNIVSGGYVTAARKGKDEFSLKVDCRFIFSTNHYPVFKDQSDGIKRRLLFVPFETKIQRVDLFFKDKLKDELSGILNWCLVGLERLLDQGRFTESDKSNRAFKEYLEESDSVHRWASSNLEWDENPDEKLYCDKLYTFYRNHEMRNGGYYVQQKEFTNRLKKWAIQDARTRGYESELFKRHESKPGSFKLPQRGDKNKSIICGYKQINQSEW